MPRLAPFEMQMREKQMLVQPAADQTLPRARCIQQALPRLDLGSLLHRWLKRLLVHLGALLQPFLQRRVLRIAQAGDRERHAAVGVTAGVVVELARQRAEIAAADAYVQFLRQPGIGRQWLAATQLEHARHQRRLAALGVEHRKEIFASPGRLAMGVEIQSRSRLGLDTGTIVHRRLVRAAKRALGTAQVQLAGRVVAGMAGDALGIEDGLDVAPIGQRFGMQSDAIQREGATNPELTKHDLYP